MSGNIIKTSKKIAFKIAIGWSFCLVVFLIFFSPFYSSQNSLNNYSTISSGNIAYTSTDRSTKGERETAPHPNEAATVEDITDTTAIIYYSFNEGTDVNDQPYDVIDVTLTGTGITDNYTVENPSPPSANKNGSDSLYLPTSSINVYGLESGTIYDDLIVHVSFTDGNTYVQDVVSFTTLGLDPVNPSPNSTATVTNIDTTTATIDYAFSSGSDELGDPYTVTNVTLSGTGITDNYIVDSPTSPTGTITLQDLDPNTGYSDLIVSATFSDSNTYNQDVDSFSTLGLTPVNPSPIDTATVTNIDTTIATINYNFDPGSDENGDPYTVTNITLAGTDITDNYIVETPTSLTGTITLQDLVLNTSYDDLIVSATFSDGNTYDQDVDPFSTLGLTPVSPSPNDTATATEITNTTATINYSFAPGSDENGDPYEVTTITLVGTGITDNYIVDSPTSAIGTIALQDLDPETNYGDLVVSATFTDGNTYDQSVDLFNTLVTVTNPSPNDTSAITNIGDTTATVNYDFSPGNDENGDPYTITEITLAGTGITNNYTVESPTALSGTITLHDLDPETSYNDLIVSATFTDGNTYEQNVDSFVTLTTIINPNPNDTATITDITDITATINYDFSPGNDENGDPYVVTEITLAGTGITDNYIVELPTSPVGIITLQGLEEETNYGDLIVSATFTDGSTYEQSVDPFTTLTTIVSPGPTDTATVTNIDTTTATINYDFASGNDENGDPYTVTDITLAGTGITNNYTVESQTAATGIITLQDLELNTSYDDLIVSITFSDDNTYNQDVNPFTTSGLTPVDPGPNGTATVTDIDTTTATINYSFSSGDDENDNPYEVTDITLAGTGITNNYTVESPTDPSGTIILQDLELNTNYNDLIVSTTFSDGNTYDQDVDPFSTLGLTPVIPGPNDTAAITDIDITTATINYSFTSGSDENGDPYTVTDITLAGTGITDNYVVESPTASTGTITLQDLELNTNYNDLIVSVTFSDGNTYDQDVDPFTTLGLAPVVPSPNDTAAVIDITDTSAIVNYSFSPGNDENGDPYEVTQITLTGTGITDNYIIDSPSAASGTIALQDLDPETDYSDLVVSITFTDGNTYDQSVDAFTTQAIIVSPPSSTPSVIKWLIISFTLFLFLVFISVLFLLGAKIFKKKK